MSKKITKKEVTGLVIIVVIVVSAVALIALGYALCLFSNSRCIETKYVNYNIDYTDDYYIDGPANQDETNGKNIYAKLLKHTINDDKYDNDYTLEIYGQGNLTDSSKWLKLINGDEYNVKTITICGDFETISDKNLGKLFPSLNCVAVSPDCEIKKGVFPDSVDVIDLIK